MVPCRQQAGPLRWASFAAATALVTVAYFLAARLGLALLEEPDGVAVFWPAAGLASGVLIVAGPARRWPILLGVIVATVSANLLGDRNLWSALLSALANAGEAAIVAALIERGYGRPFELNTLGRVIGFFIATLVGVAVSGIPGTLGFLWFHATTATTATIWSHWVTSDALGTLTEAPLVIGLASLMRNIPSRRDIAEAFLAIFVLCGLCAFLVLSPDRPWTLALAIVFLCPMFVWIAARLPPEVTSAATFICAITIVAATTFSVGIFGDPRWPLEQRVETAQASILAISFGALVLSALFSERRLHEVSLLESETRLQEALRAGGVMAFEWDLVADEIRHSENAAIILGSKGEGILRGSAMLGQIHPEDRPLVAACLDRIRPGAPSFSVTFRYRDPEADSEVWLEQVATAQFNSDGSPTLIRGLTTNITERKRSEEEISRARSAAERADRSKSVFLAAASHDLRQPLQTLTLLQDSLEQHVPGGDQRGVLEDMRHSIDTMSSMLSSLLDINGLESGGLQPSKSDFAIHEIFDSVTTDVLHPLAEKGLQWRVVPSQLVVCSDRRMLEEMIRNLISNAIRYTDRGKVLLGCRRSGEMVRIEVWDTGIGIAGDQLPRIFEEYYRDTERGGFGLGLAIVRRLGEILGHRVDVRSTPGKGTVFCIEVPRGRLGVEVSALNPMADLDDEPFTGTVLVVEDEMSVRSALIRVLRSKGVSAVAAPGIDDALALIHHGQLSPDLLLCDYNLPGPMNGLDGIRSLRAALRWECPAIVITGDIRAGTVDAVGTRGVSVLIKPFSAEELMPRISQLCRASGPRRHDRDTQLLGGGRST